MEDGFFIKILVVGDSGVGKTSILNRYCHNRFDQAVAATIGCDFSLKILNDFSGQTIRLQLWDVAGQERFHSVSKLYIRGSLGSIIVCDVTSEDSLNSVIRWRDVIEENSDLIAGESIPIILIQNKIDLLEDVGKLEPFQTKEFLQEFARKNRFIESYQVSAKNDINLKESINCLLQEIFRRNIFNESERGNSLRGSNIGDTPLNKNSSIKLSDDNQFGKNEYQHQQSNDNEQQRSCC